MSNFAEGDIVRSKGGGPNMTIIALSQNELDGAWIAKCTWSNGNIVQETYINVSELELVK